MKVLIDTPALLWFLSGDGKMSLAGRQVMSGTAHTRVVSVVVLWELSAMVAAGKVDVGRSVADFVDCYLKNSDIEVIPVQLAESVAVATLPLLHTDPYDRLLVSQSLAFDMPVVSPNPIFDDYGVERIW